MGPGRAALGRLGSGAAVLAGDLLLVGPIPLLLSANAPTGAAPFAALTIGLGVFVVVGRNASTRLTDALGFQPGEGNAGQLVEGVRAVTSGVYCGFTWLDPSIARCSILAAVTGAVATVAVAPLLVPVRRPAPDPTAGSADVPAEGPSADP